MTSDAKRSAALACIALAWVLSPRALTAQATSRATQPGAASTALRGEFERAVVLEDATIARIDVRLAAIEALARETARDTIRVAPVMVASAPAFGSAVRLALADVVPHLRTRWGAALVDATFAGVIARVVPVQERSFGRTSTVLQASLLRGGREERIVRLSLTANDDTVGTIAKYLEITTAEIIGERAGAPLGAWLGRVRLSDPPDNGSRAFEDLVTAPALVARQCAAGNDERCLDALGLAPRADARTAWYTEEDRRVVARSWWRNYHRKQVSEDAENPCQAQPITPACGAWVDSLSPSVWTTPLGPDARRALVVTAVTLGGDGAWGRFVVDPVMATTERVASAARRPTLDVVRAWRARVLASRPEPVLPRGSVLLASTGVLLLALGIATRRQVRR